MRSTLRRWWSGRLSHTKNAVATITLPKDTLVYSQCKYNVLHLRYSSWTSCELLPRFYALLIRRSPWTNWTNDIYDAMRCIDHLPIS